MSEALIPQSESQPYFHRPFTQDQNPLYVQPIYQRYVGTEPRFFNHTQKEIALERQGYVCPICGEGIGIYNSECHHCVQWQANGASTTDNLVVLHKGSCHHIADERAKSGDMIVGGTIFDAEPSQFRAGHKAPMYTKPPSL